MANAVRHKWKRLTIPTDGELLTVYLHPPGTVGNTRYWAFSCREASITKKSLKCNSLKDAKLTAIKLLTAPKSEDESKSEETLTWGDWDSIQVAYYRKKANEKRANRTLEECRKAMRLFVRITGAPDASSVDADMVDRFQSEGVQRKKGDGKPYSASTVWKTMAHMSSSFNRCRISAGKRCVRGVVDQSKLLMVNAFEEVNWIEPTQPRKLQFSREGLKAFLAWAYLAGCPLLSLFAKVSLWARGRIEEMSELGWDWIDDQGYVGIPDEQAKWGKGKLVKIPLLLVEELRRYRGSGPFVWERYVEQVRDYHRNTGHLASAHKMLDFSPARLKVHFQKQIQRWAKTSENVGLSHHAFRRTGLQWSREGQLRMYEAEYAKSSNLSLGVADSYYTRDPRHLRADIVFRSIAGELSADRELAEMMGLRMPAPEEGVTVESVENAIRQGNLDEAERLLVLLKSQRKESPK